MINTTDSNAPSATALESSARDAACDVLSRICGAQAGERVLLLTDGNTPPGTCELFASTVRELGLTCEVFPIDYAEAEQHYPATAARLTELAPHIVLELTSTNLYESLIYPAARAAGARVFSIGNMTLAAVARCFIPAGAARIAARTSRFYERLSRARELRIQDARGTDLRMRLNPNRVSRLISKLRREPRSWVWQPSPVQLAPGESGFPVGQLAWIGILPSIQGRVVSSAYLGPTDAFGHLRGDLALEIKAGQVIAITGSDPFVAALNRWLTPDRTILHFCLGFDHHCTLEGELTEAERMAGAVTVGFGAHPRHADVVTLDTTLLLDGERIDVLDV